MSKVVIFGNLDSAELAWYYLQNDSPHEVVAFTVHEQYMNAKSFKGLPLIPFEEIVEKYPPDDHKLFVPMTGRKMNTLREQVYQCGKSMGYSYVSYVSSKATICGNEIGENCFILEDNTVQPFTKLGNDIVLWNSNHIVHHGQIKDHNFFTSHVVMSGHCVIEPNCFLGVNSTIRDFSTLAKGTLLAMGACLVQQETEE